MGGVIKPLSGTKGFMDVNWKDISGKRNGMTFVGMSCSRRVRSSIRQFD